MNIPERLSVIVNAIAHDTVADIGTDHAYIPISALQRNRAKRVIACDINPRPLDAARRNIAVRGFAQAAEVRLGDGFSPIAAGEVETAVLAGMGGTLIVDILRRGEAQVRQLSQLLLSPQSDVPPVRRAVHEMGFMIRNEQLIDDEGVFYFILDCRKGTEAAYTELEYTFGKRLIEKRDPLFLRYVKKEVERLTRAARRIEQGGARGARAQARLLAIQAEQRAYEAIIITNQPAI